MGAPKGEKNWRWNGGTSDYPDHSLMKRNRLVKLQQSKGRCEVCGKRAYQIHHIDESRNNHTLENLVVVCNHCHGILHTGRTNKTTKYIRKYGKSAKEMALQFGCSTGTITHLDRSRKLEGVLKAGQWQRKRHWKWYRKPTKKCDFCCFQQYNKHCGRQKPLAGRVCEICGKVHC